jgi:hypothetical protein
MKFRFCGELDAPDWLLREIELLSKIPVLRIKLLVKEVIAHILSGQLDYDKVLGVASKTGLGASDIKAAIAALDFIVTNGAKYNVDPQVLINELQQLGLPKEHCDGVARLFSDSKQDLRAKFQSQTLLLEGIQAVDWRVDYILASNNLNNVNAPTVQLNIVVKEARTGTTAKTQDTENTKSKAHSFEIDAEKFRVLLAELQTARSMMDSLKQLSLSPSDDASTSK